MVVGRPKRPPADDKPFQITTTRKAAGNKTDKKTDIKKDVMSAFDWLMENVFDAEIFIEEIFKAVVGVATGGALYLASKRWL